MKRRMLIPIVMIALMLLSCYKMVGDKASAEKEYQQYLSEARKAADMDTKYAVEYYQKALEVMKTPELYYEIAEYYKPRSQRNFLSWCEEFQAEFPKEPLAYQCLLEANYQKGDYTACFDTIYTADKRGITNEVIEQIREKLRYEYVVESGNYDEAGVFSNNLCAVRKGDKWGFVNRFGESRVSVQYAAVECYTQSGFAPVKDQDGKVFFIDGENGKVLTTKESYLQFGPLAGGVFAAQRPDGKYVYLDTDFVKVIGDYDEAGAFNGGRAAVKSNGKWMVIDAAGKQIGSDYTDIKMDEKTIAFRCSRAFVSVSAGKYILIDENGQRVGQLEFADAMPFNASGAAAVKIGNSWCFINTDGQRISAKTYEEARSFSSGLAAVCMNGKWGFVDENEQIVIEPKFDGAKDFTEKGSCFVKRENYWSLLKIYRLNRRDS